MQVIGAVMERAFCWIRIDGDSALVMPGPLRHDLPAYSAGRQTASESASPRTFLGISQGFRESHNLSARLWGCCQVGRSKWALSRVVSWRLSTPIRLAEIAGVCEWISFHRTHRRC